MNNLDELKQRLKSLMVENLMLQVSAAEIADEQPLFGPQSLGLDSVDALQLVVALDKNFGLKMRRYRKRQSNIHSARIMFHGRIEKILHLAKGNNLVELPSNFGFRHTQDCAIQKNVLPPGKLGVEAGSHFEQ